MSTENFSLGVRQMAAEMANAESEVRWTPEDFTGPRLALAVALARLATHSLERDAKLEEVLSDLREIDRLLSSLSNRQVNQLARYDDIVPKALTIAAKHRVETDPLLIEAREIVATFEEAGGHTDCAVDVRAGKYDSESDDIRLVMSGLKRGAELARSSETE